MWPFVQKFPDFGAVGRASPPSVMSIPPFPHSQHTENSCLANCRRIKYYEFTYIIWPSALHIVGTTLLFFFLSPGLKFVNNSQFLLSAHAGPRSVQSGCVQCFTIYRLRIEATGCQPFTRAHAWEARLNPVSPRPESELSAGRTYPQPQQKDGFFYPLLKFPYNVTCQLYLTKKISMGPAQGRF